MITCNIDGGMLEHIAQEGYVNRWKCRRCKVEWILRPEATLETDRGIIQSLLEQKLREYEMLKKGDMP